jgi:arylsulfatase A-like enzyme
VPGQLARPNVILLVLDAVRRDALEPYGAPPGRSPAIADLARRGVAAPDVYATACWTVPSHASLFTGLLPRAAGLSRVASWSSSHGAMEPLRHRVLPEVLRRDGYATAAVTANLWVSERSGFANGFDEVASVDINRHGTLQRSGGLRDRYRWVTAAARGRGDDGAGAAQAVIGDWIERARRDGQPFFWFANLMEAHSPYLPPRPYGEVSTLDRIRAADESRRYYTLGPIWGAAIGRRVVPEATLERMRRLYAGAVRLLDDWVAALLERLDTAGLFDDTLVIVTSDHGENFGENGLIAHAHSLDNRLIHVPFVVAGPGDALTPPRSLAEVPRFVADAVGLAEHPWHEELPEGAGIAQFDPPVDADDPRLQENIGELGWTDDNVRRFTTPLTCAARDGVKVLLRGDVEELYDVSVDPLESAPLSPEALAPERRAIVGDLRRALEHPVATARGIAPPAAAAAAASREPSAEELRDIEERMRLLGYL